MLNWEMTLGWYRLTRFDVRVSLDRWWSKKFVSKTNHVSVAVKRFRSNSHSLLLCFSRLLNRFQSYTFLPWKLSRRFRCSQYLVAESSDQSDIYVKPSLSLRIHMIITYPIFPFFILWAPVSPESLTFGRGRSSAQKALLCMTQEPNPENVRQWHTDFRITVIPKFCCCRYWGKQF